MPLLEPQREFCSLRRTSAACPSARALRRCPSDFRLLICDFQLSRVFSISAAAAKIAAAGGPPSTPAPFSHRLFNPATPVAGLTSVFLPSPQCAPYFNSPASIRTASRFSFGGKGQVAYGVKAHGGL